MKKEADTYREAKASGDAGLKEAGFKPIPSKHPGVKPQTAEKNVLSSVERSAKRILEVEKKMKDLNF